MQALKAQNETNQMEKGSLSRAALLSTFNQWDGKSL